MPEIRSFFWKWRRHHQPQHQTNLQRFFPNLPVAEKYMQNLGIFGDVIQPQGGLADGRAGQRQAGVSRMALGLEMADMAMPGRGGRRHSRGHCDVKE